MSLLSFILSLAGLGGLGGVVTFLLGPAKVLGALRQALGIAEDGLAWLFKTPAAMAIVAGLCLAFALLQWGEARHWRKADAGDLKARQTAEKIVGAVKAEVDRGVGKATPAADAPVYVRAFVDNLATVKAALDRQSAALKAAQQDADAHRVAAAAAAKPTPAQQQREKDRQAIVQGTGALTPRDWSKL